MTRLMHLPVTLDIRSVGGQGEQASAHVIALWLLRVEPEDRERALDVVMKVFDDNYADRPLQRDEAKQRWRSMVVREFSAIVCHLQREHKQLSTLQ